MKKNTNILIFTYWSYKDALIQTYTLPYVKMIRSRVPRNRKIFLYTFESEYFKMNRADWEQECERLKNEGIILKKSGYRNFGLFAFILNIFTIFRILLLVLFNKVRVIHAFCTPAGSMAWIIKKLTGVKLIIDSYEPHAESMIENGVWKKESFAFRLLFHLEKRISKSAEAVIATTNGMYTYAEQKYKIKLKNFYVKPSCVDNQLFDPKKYNKIDLRKKWKISENAVLGVYIGKFGGIYLEEEIIMLIKEFQNYWKERSYTLICTNKEREWITEKCKKYQVNQDYIMVIPYLPHNQIPSILAMADFGINPVKPIPTKQYCTSIKDGEYWAMGLPVIITPNISDDSKIIQDQGIGAVIKTIDLSGFISAVSELDEAIKKQQSSRIIEISKEVRSLKIAENIYNELYLP